MGRTLRDWRVCLGVVVAVLAAACHQPAPDADAGRPMFTQDHGLYAVPADSPLRRQVTVQAVGVGAASDTLELPAAVEADPAEVGNVLAPLTGRVTSLRVALGQRVVRGQVLATLASGDFDQARADDAKARDALDLAQMALARAQGVQQAGGSAVKDVEADRSALAQAQAEAVRAHARLVALNGAGGASGGALELRAPLTGVVTALSLGRGQQVGDPTAVLMTVTGLGHVFVTANVPEDEIGKVRVGEDAAVTLASEPGQMLHGRIAEVDAVIQADTRRQRARIALPNADGRLAPGLYATVRLSVPAAGGVYAPQTALLMNNDATTVLVEVRPWVFQRRAVTLGDQTDTAARVLEGLQPGERVVTRGGVLFGD
jgi:cobalt-zinc-cadmium efflux system membrane fusion protein